MRFLEVIDNLRFLSPSKEETSVNTPSDLRRQVFLMNFPLTLNTSKPNNDWMKQAAKKGELKINYEDAFEQFHKLYAFIVAQGVVVYLLPSEGDFQDQEYVANLGIYLPHKKEATVILANFTSQPRRGEELVGERFFEQMKYNVAMCPHKWEGEAELKFLRDNIYFGGHGIRSELASYKWMEKKFDMTIVPIEITDGEIYHLDTSFLRLTENKVMMPTEAMKKSDVRAVEKYAEIINVPLAVVKTGATNAVACGKHLMYASVEHLLDGYNKGTIRKAIQYVEKAAGVMKLEPKAFNLHEFERSGADLGCLIMHLNYFGY